MTSLQLYRWSGLALLVGMVLSIISTVGSGILFPNSNDPAAAMSPLNILLSVVGVIGSVAALLGLPALYARSALEGGLVWLVGVVLIAVTGMLFGIFMGLMSAIVFPALAERAPTLFGAGPPPGFLVLFVVGTLANALGALGMGIPMLTKRIYPAWCGYLMLLEAVFAVVGFVVNGPDSGPIGMILNVIAPLPLFVVIGYCGYQLWSHDAAAAAEAPPRVVAQPA